MQLKETPDVSIPLTTFLTNFSCFRLDIGGHSTFFGLLNTFVHIVMYSYYLFAAMGPQFQKYLWWKKYLTSLQMVRCHARLEREREWKRQILIDYFYYSDI